MSLSFSFFLFLSQGQNSRGLLFYGESSEKGSEAEGREAEGSEVGGGREVEGSEAEVTSAQLPFASVNVHESAQAYKSATLAAEAVLVC